jgi:hypothetical protein
MSDQAILPIFGDDIPASSAPSAEPSSLLVDSAISHAEKLRRVVELEEWINGARDLPMLASTCRKWQQERAQLLAELHL